MRRLLAVVALATALSAFADSPPKGLQPLPAPPPPPPGYQPDQSLEPQVTITRRGQDKVEEYRVRGKLYMIKVTPPHGKPYYLIDENGDGKMVREDPLDSGLRVPLWVIKSF